MLTWIGSPLRRSRRLLLLDRDGVLNENRPDHVKHWGEYRFYPDALDALRWLKEHRVEVILISNQSGLGRGLTAWPDFWELHERMIRSVREAGGDIQAAFYCPHRPDEGCSCRKPAPGMILAACALYGITPEATCMIGDSATDVDAAHRAGCPSVLLSRTANSASPRTRTGDPHDPDGRASPSLFDVVRELYGGTAL